MGMGGMGGGHGYGGGGYGQRPPPGYGHGYGGQRPPRQRGGGGGYGGGYGGGGGFGGDEMAQMQAQARYCPLSAAAAAELTRRCSPRSPPPNATIPALSDGADGNGSADGATHDGATADGRRRLPGAAHGRHAAAAHRPDAAARCAAATPRHSSHAQPSDSPPRLLCYPPSIPPSVLAHLHSSFSSSAAGYPPQMMGGPRGMPMGGGPRGAPRHAHARQSQSHEMPCHQI